VWERMAACDRSWTGCGSPPILLVVKRFVHKAMLYFGLEETVDIMSERGSLSGCEAHAVDFAIGMW
jgi:hypothetical protein